MEILVDYAKRETVTLRELLPKWWGAERYRAGQDRAWHGETPQSAAPTAPLFGEPELVKKSRRVCARRRK